MKQSSKKNTWVQVLKDPEVKNLQGNSLLLGITNWKKTDVDAILAHFTFTVADISQLSKLKKTGGCNEPGYCN